MSGRFSISSGIEGCVWVEAAPLKKRVSAWIFSLGG
jgi:hypothetical protein